MDFLYGDKKAELMSEISFTKYAFENYASIMAHEAQRAATITSLQSAKKVAMNDIEFYIHDLNLKKKIWKKYWIKRSKFGTVCTFPLNYML